MQHLCREHVQQRYLLTSAGLVTIARLEAHGSRRRQLPQIDLLYLNPITNTAHQSASRKIWKERYLGLASFGRFCSLWIKYSLHSERAFPPTTA
ncbi:hypothetical protein OPQ81_007936 [Rhizoctonia solani]|nr:hypothetical protein OPQ81_007936 [Rhizoctonia solani]